METELKNEMSERAVRYMDYLEETLQKGGDFVADQAPEVVRELILYQRVHLSVMVAGALILFIATFVFWVRKVVPEYLKKSPEWCEAKAVGGTFFSIITSIAYIGVFFGHFDSFVKVWLAPRVFILEEIARLL